MLINNSFRNPQNLFYIISINNNNTTQKKDISIIYVRKKGALLDGFFHYLFDSS